jgi:hypothetical protein
MDCELIDFYSGKAVTKEFVDAENKAFDYTIGPHVENKEWIASIVKEKFDFCHSCNQDENLHLQGYDDDYFM